DRIEHPSAHCARRTDEALLLTEHGVVRPGGGERVAHDCFRPAVGFGDGRVVGLGRDLEIAGTEAWQGDGVGQLGEVEGEGEVGREVEVGVHDADGNDGGRFSRTAATPSAASGPRNVSISYANDASKAGTASRIQWLSARLVRRTASCGPVARRSAIASAVDS